MYSFRTSTSARAPAPLQVPVDMVRRVVRQHLVVCRDPAEDVAADGQVREGAPAGENDVGEDEQLLRRRVDADVAAGVVLAIVAQLQRLLAPRRACSRP